MNFTGSEYYTLSIKEDNTKFLLLYFFPNNYIVINGNHLYKVATKISEEEQTTSVL